MSHQPERIYVFGPFRLDAAERLLLRDHEVIPLQPKVLDLLPVLVERRGHLLEKDELMSAVRQIRRSHRRTEQSSRGIARQYVGHARLLLRRVWSEE
jgi:DNA-binding winged helix-turn-helix (wHTH) protein